MKITNINASPFIPQATETQNGYAYLVGYITMYPGSSLGINIKSYNYKVTLFQMKLSRLVDINDLLPTIIDEAYIPRKEQTISILMSVLFLHMHRLFESEKNL